MKDSEVEQLKQLLDESTALSLPRFDAIDEKLKDLLKRVKHIEARAG